MYNKGRFHKIDGDFKEIIREKRNKEDRFSVDQTKGRVTN